MALRQVLDAVFQQEASEMSTPQQYWDACLIRTWRKAGTVFDVVTSFQSITNKKLEDFDPPLLRTPKLGFPWKIGVRVFVANHLSKISKRLWEQPAEKDIALLNKLKESKYDTEKEAVEDKALGAEQRAAKRSRAKIEYSITKYANRNHATDWNVNKGPR